MRSTGARRIARRARWAPRCAGPRRPVSGRAPTDEPRGALGDAMLRTLPDSSKSAPQVAALIAACAQQERAGLLAALDGRRVAPGPAGAPTRGRLDVLPTGRNLT